MFHGSQSSSCKLKLHSTLLNTKKIGFGKLPRPWRCDCHLPDKPCSSNAYLWAHTLGSDLRWTKQNLINRLGLKKHLKRQLIMFYMTGNATQKQKRSELLNKHFHHRMAPSSKKPKPVQTASKLVLQLLPVLDSDIRQVMFKTKIRGESKEKVEGWSMHTEGKTQSQWSKYSLISPNVLFIMNSRAICYYIHLHVSEGPGVHWVIWSRYAYTHSITSILDWNHLTMPVSQSILAIKCHCTVLGKSFCLPYKEET